MAGSPGGSGSASATTQLLDASVSYQPPYPVSVTGAFAVHHDGRVVTATIDAAGRHAQAYPYPPDFDTDNWPPAPHPMLAPGRRMLVLGDVLPLCDGKEHDPPTITITSRSSSGEIISDRFAVAADGSSVEDTAAYIDQVTNDFCSRGVTAELSQSSSSGRVTYVIRNPGPDEVTVTSKEWHSGPARWEAASIDVPADGQEHRLTVHGSGGICSVAGIQGPLTLGLLSATGPDGKSHPVTGPDGPEAICGG